MRLYKLNETVLDIKGNSALFLNGISSNTLEAPLNAFLNQHGRIIATFRQHRINDGQFLISVPPVAMEALLKHLERYAKLSHVSIEPCAWGVYIDLDTAKTVWSDKLEQISVNDEEFTLFRLNNNMPLMGVDFQADEFILNVDEFKYVSYTKGCFLGQEPVAKVHNRSRPSRKLLVKFEGEIDQEQAAAMTSKAFDDKAGLYKGFLFMSNKPS